MKRLACAFTGHRPSKLPWREDETAEACVQMKELLTVQIQELIQKGVTDFLSGMAQGIDTICAEIVLSLREKNPAIKLHCILPCLEQDKKWPTAARERYHSILGEADSIVYVNRSACKNCMLKRDHFLVEWSACLLAVYNGERRGGTAATVNYARKAGREIRILDPSTQSVTLETPMSRK